MTKRRVTALGKECTGTGLSLRVQLFKLAKNATKLLPFSECHVVLVELKGESDELEELQPPALIDGLNQTSDEHPEG